MSYSLRIHNQSGHDHPYVVFTPPSQAEPTDGPVVYNNAWSTFPNITDGGWDGGPYTGPAAFQVAVGGDGQTEAVRAEVDFTGRSESAVEVTHTAQGWTVAYR